MKNKYFQESQDLTNRQKKSVQDSVDDASHNLLVAFLKQNKAIAPPPAPNFEQQLFAEISKCIEKSSKRSSKRSSKFLSKINLQHWRPWTLFIPVAIAASLTFNGDNNRAPMQMANNSHQISMSEAEEIAIEQTLINNWNVTDEAQVDSQTSISDVQILNELLTPE